MSISPAVFESIMMITFGCAWPASIYKTFTSRSNQGKSIFFLWLVLVGYVCGTIFQLQAFGSGQRVIYLFFLNTAMVLIDIVLYYRNSYLAVRRDVGVLDSVSLSSSD